MAQQTACSLDTDSDDSSDSELAFFTVSESEVFLSSEEDSSSSDNELHSTSSTSDLSTAATFRKQARRDDVQWDTVDFLPSLFTFDDSQSGQVATSLLPPEASELAYFQLFIDDQLLSLIVMGTNKYGSEKAAACHSGASRLRAWVAVNLPELYCFLAVVLLMGLVRKNTLQDYW